MSKTTFINAGRIGDRDGELSFSYMPEHDAILLLASVPSDNRRASISIRLSDTAPLRDILNSLEASILDEAKRRAKQDPDNSLVNLGQDVVSVRVSGAAISLPRQFYEDTAMLIKEGKAVLATSNISKSLPWLGAAGAKEVTQSIYEHLRSNGERE